MTKEIIMQELVDSNTKINEGLVKSFDNIMFQQEKMDNKAYIFIGFASALLALINKEVILNNTVNYFLSFAISLLIMSLLPIATNFGVQILQKIIKVDKSEEHNIFYYTDLYKLDLTTFISIMQTEYKLHNISIFDKKIIEQILINAKILKLKVFYHTLAYFVLFCCAITFSLRLLIIR
jgi:hypothetical protein